MVHSHMTLLMNSEGRRRGTRINVVKVCYWLGLGLEWFGSLE
jgi:hypothetical protein